MENGLNKLRMIRLHQRSNIIIHYVQNTKTSNRRYQLIRGKARDEETYAVKNFTYRLGEIFRRVIGGIDDGSCIVDIGSGN